jgi:hypothetical protein
MSTFETILHLATALLPSIGVLAFLLLHQRERIQAELTEQRLQHEHCQARQEQDTQRIHAFTTAAQAFAPVLGASLARLLPKRSMSAADLSDQEIAAELRRRFYDRDCEGCEFAEPPAPAPESTESPIN